jgi:hypothetical protein
VTGTERRKTFAEGRLYAGDLLTAEAQAIFIAADRARFLELIKERERLEQQRSG